MSDQPTGQSPEPVPVPAPKNVVIADYVVDAIVAIGVILLVGLGKVTWVEGSPVLVGVIAARTALRGRRGEPPASGAVVALLATMGIFASQRNV